MLPALALDGSTFCPHFVDSSVVPEEEIDFGGQVIISARSQYLQDERNF